MHHVLCRHHKHITYFNFTASITRKKYKKSGFGNNIPCMNNNAQPMILHIPEQPDSTIDMLQIAKNNVMNCNQSGDYNQWQPISINGNKCYRDEYAEMHFYKTL